MHKTNDYFYYLSQNKLYVTALLASLTLFFAILGFLYEDKSWVVSISSALKFFTFNFPDDYKDSNVFILIGSILSTITVFLAAIFTFFQEYLNRQNAKRILKTPHIALFGLGEINQAFLKSNFDTNENNIIIVERDQKHPLIDTLRTKGFGVIIGDVLANTQFDLFNFEKTEAVIIALGNDELNIEVAIRIINTIQTTGIQSPTRLIVHIADKRLNTLFHHNFIVPNSTHTASSVRIDIKTFSFFEECSKALFEQNYIDGDSRHYISSSQEFASIVCGSGQLALATIEQMLLLSNLPYKNHHTIHLVDKEAQKLFDKITHHLYYNTEKFPNVSFEIHLYDAEESKFFTMDIWHYEHLVHAILCHDREEINLKIAIELYERLYRRNATLPTKVLVGLFKECSLSQCIDDDQDGFQRFKTFGNEQNLFNNKTLLDETNYRIAKCIHFGYGDVFNKESLSPEDEKLNEKWYTTAKFSDKLSNIAQAKHIDIKLKALGLKKEKSDLTPQDLLKYNQEIFDSIITPLFEETGLSYKKLYTYSLELEKFWAGNEYKVFYTPKVYTSLLEKLIVCEHERWNSYHYINGWEYSPQKDKALKFHDCLKPLSEFTDDKHTITILYDLYSIVYLPNYLANAGWKMSTEGILKKDTLIKLG